MQVQVNDKNEVVGFAATGTIGGGITINAVPDNFVTDFKSGYYVLVNGVLSINPNYVDPSTIAATDEPSTDQQMIMAQSAKIVEMQTIIQQLTLAVTKLGGTINDTNAGA